MRPLQFRILRVLKNHRDVVVPSRHDESVDAVQPLRYRRILCPISTASRRFPPPPGGAQFTLTVNGDNFVAASTVSWMATALVDDVRLSATQLTAIVTAAADRQPAARAGSLSSIQRPAAAHPISCSCRRQ